MFCTSIRFKIENKHYRKSLFFLLKKSVIFFSHDLFVPLSNLTKVSFLSSCFESHHWLLFFFCLKKGSLDILINQYDQILSIWALIKLAIIFYNIMHATYHKYVTSWIATWHCLVPSPINTFIHLQYHISLLYFI